MSESIYKKSYEELGFTDYFMFGKVMEDPKLCHDVLECLLQMPVGEIVDNQREKEFRHTRDGKYVRLDIFSRSDKGVSYDTEMENLNGKSIEWHAYPRRCRYYQANMDINFLNAGEPYADLPESNVIFICTFDPFGLGLSQYTFRERCDEKNSLLLGDGTAKYFFNCTYKGGEIPEAIRMLYDYIETGATGDELTKKIETAVDQGRRNELWRGEYLKEQQVIMEAVRAERDNTEAERKRADEAEKRADEESKRADEEGKRADEESKRADEEKNRAENAEARIKELEAMLAAK